MHIQDILNQQIKYFVYILLGVFLLFICSQLTIPLRPIPITMQTVGVMLIGLLCERYMASLIVLIYLVAGALGFPVFANMRGGMQSLLGPSGGYLLGFLAAVILMTSLKNYLKDNNIYHLVTNCCLGTLCILVFGVTWLGFSIGFAAAIKSGLYPFIIPGIIKIIITVAIVYCIKHVTANLQA